jgi:hypothetical protein
LKTVRHRDGRAPRSDRVPILEDCNIDRWSVETHWLVEGSGKRMFGCFLSGCKSMKKGGIYTVTIHLVPSKTNERIE